jgi:hypothetical protein
VIANERQYRISKAQLRRFEEAARSGESYAPGRGVDPRMRDVMADALEGQAETLRSEVRRYEDLREGRVEHREIDGLRDLPIALIEARIAAGPGPGRLGGRPKEGAQTPSSRAFSHFFQIRHTHVATFCLRSCAIMATMEKWSDERLDDLNQRVESGFNRLDADLRNLRVEMISRFDRVDSRFDRVDARFVHVDDRFDALQRTMLQVGGGIVVALIGLIATQL